MTHVSEPGAEPGNTSPAASLDAPAVLRAALAAVALLTVLLAAFAWPAGELRPRSLPVAVVAPTSSTATTVADRLADAFGDDGVAVVQLVDREAAVSAIVDREVYGAVVVRTDGSEVLTAGAAGPTVAQLLTGVAQHLSAGPGSAPPTTTDVVPTPDGDPRGAVFAAGALPLAMGGLLVGALPSLTLRRTRDRLLAALLAAAGAGSALAGLLQGPLDALGGGYAANAAVIGLGVLAVALPVVGLHRVLGRPGIAAVAALVMLVGNPLSGIASAPELLPLGWLGQLLPPGAAGTALRGTAFFDGAGTGAALAVLTAWAAAGLLLAVVPGTRAPDAGRGATSERTATTVPA